MQKPATSPNYQIRALDRALDILEAFIVDKPELDLNAICERVNLPKSTVFKILAVLENRGYVRKSETNGSYGIGFRAFDVGNHYLAGLTLFGVVHPLLEKLATRFPQSMAHLAILSPTNTKMVYLDVVSLNISLLLSPIPASRRFYVHCTALGKCLLAGLPAQELDRLLAQIEMPKLTQHTITDPQVLREHLNLVRTQGYAIDDEESSLGNLCVAVPVRDRQGRTIAAMSTSHTKEALLDDVSTVIAEMYQAGEEAARSLGYAPPPAPVEM